ncbi:hypothetical protein NXS19_013877 [Fusarium pseudograminearum]|nr:hypothetical protein NXS19_013877 [Fusarium pseudograminearum]
MVRNNNTSVLSPLIPDIQPSGSFDSTHRSSTDSSARSSRERYREFLSPRSGQIWTAHQAVMSAAGSVN